VFNFVAGEVRCAEANFHGNLAAAAVTLTMSATYSGCTTPGGAEVVIDMTSCDYLFHAGETIAQHKVDGWLDVTCAQAGDEIDIVEPATGCVVKIPAQEGLTTLVYTNNTMARDFNVDIALTGILYTQNEFCNGGAGVFANGQYTGQSTFIGDREGQQDGLIVD